MGGNIVNIPNPAHAGGARRRLGRMPPVAAVALLAVMSAACTVFQPVQPPPADYFFAEAVPPSADCAPASSPAAPCTYVPPDADRYAGGLGRMIWQVDRRRVQLSSRAADVTNITTSYNALLWPLGGLAILSKLHTPSESLLWPAAIAATSYGFLSSGVPEREKLYLLASRQLACSVLGASAYLYRKHEVLNAFSDEAAQFESDQMSSVSMTLDDAQSRLRTAARDYRRARLTFFGAVSRPAPPPSGDSGTNAVERRAMKARGEGGRSSGPANPLPKIDAQAATRIAQAQRTLDDLARLRARMFGEADLLRSRWQFVENSLQTALTERAPPLARFQSVLDAFKAEGLVVAQAPAASDASGTLQGGAREGDPRTADWAVPQSLAAGLRSVSDRKALATFNEAALALQDALIEADKWLRLDRARTGRMVAALKKQRCDVDAVITLPPPAPPVSPAADPASAPASGRTRPTTPATPTSGTPLDDLGDN